MKTRKLIILVILTLASITGCKSKFELLLNNPDTELKYAAAFDLFNTGSYAKSAKLFEALSVITTGTERDDTVQYYWALSNYRSKDYFTAVANFQHFLESHPNSPFAPDAAFLKIDCMYMATLRWELDQNPTYKAMQEIGEYMVNNIDSPHIQACQRMLDELRGRLDRKAYENACLYYKMEDYKAANVALKNVLKDNSDNRYREQILYYACLSSYKYASMSVPEKQAERFMVFKDDYLNFIGEYPESEYREEIDALIKKVKKNETKVK